MGRADFRIIIHRDGSLKSTTLRVPVWLVRAAGASALTFVLLLVALIALYGPMYRMAARVPVLEARVARLRADNEKVHRLARALEEAEVRYRRLRSLLGVDASGGAASASVGSGAGDPVGGDYVAPPIMARRPVAPIAAASADPWVPHLWPLAGSGYLTRGLVRPDRADEAHSGLDIAAPMGADVRATGAGVVRAVERDPAYGLFVLLAHQQGYESMYGHLSRALVVRGERISAGQVIALSGNSGRSTAPHLHFEIRLNGRNLDPLTMVKEGA